MADRSDFLGRLAKCHVIDMLDSSVVGSTSGLISALVSNVQGASAAYVFTTEVWRLPTDLILGALEPVTDRSMRTESP